MMDNGNPQHDADLDEAVLLELEELPSGSANVLREVGEEYLRVMPENLERLCEHLNGEDFDQVYRSAHTLKGSCGGIGAVGLEALFRSLETAAKQRELETMRALESRGRQAFEIVRQRLRDRIDGSSENRGGRCD